VSGAFLEGQTPFPHCVFLISSCLQIGCVPIIPPNGMNSRIPVEAIISISSCTRFRDNCNAGPSIPSRAQPGSICLRGLAGSGTALSFSDGCGNRGTCRNRGPRQSGLARPEKDERRFRVREWWGCSTPSVPLSRTRRPVCEEDHTCPEPEETGHKRMRRESRKALPWSGLLPKESANGPSSRRAQPMTHFRRTPGRHARLFGSSDCGRDVRSVYPLEPPSCSARIPGRLAAWSHLTSYGPKLSIASPIRIGGMLTGAFTMSPDSPEKMVEVGDPNP
jgi:hypothetical protein